MATNAEYHRIPAPGQSMDVPLSYDLLAAQFAYTQDISILTTGNQIVFPIHEPTSTMRNPRREKRVLVFDAINALFGVLEISNDSQSETTEIWRIKSFVRPSYDDASEFYLALVKRSVYDPLITKEHVNKAHSTIEGMIHENKQLLTTEKQRLEQREVRQNVEEKSWAILQETLANQHH